MPKDVIITPEGLANLKAELDHLTTTRRREVASRIKEAREFGDISENAEYDDAKKEQARAEASPGEAKLSNESPVGKALLGRKRGDEVSITTPKGERRLKITKIDVES